VTWNHRVFLSNANPEEPWFDIRETYYGEDGNPNACTADAIAPGGGTPLELADELSRMLAACSKPVLQIVGDKIVEAK